MSNRTFTWEPAPDVDLDTEERRLEARYGDGYSQRAPDGLNSIERKWMLEFRGPLLRLDAITDFLDDHRGGESFNWLPPRASAPVRVICEAQRSGTFNTLRYGSMRVTFRQVPA